MKEKLNECLFGHRSAVLLILFLVSTLICAQHAYGQVNVRGSVTDNSGVTIPGVTVFVKGTTHGTSTDADGKYYISNIPGNSILIFSSVGLQPLEVQVAGRYTEKSVSCRISLNCQI